MPVILFRGTVRPPIFRLNIDRLPTVRYGWPADNLTADFMVTVKESALEVRYEVSRFDKDAHLSMLTMHAYNIAQAAVDCFCFSTGIGLAVFIEIFIDPNGKRTTLVSKIDIVDGLCAAFNLDPSFTGPNNYESMFNIVMSDRQVLLALNDLTITIGHFDLAAINCARAMEALRTSMTPAGSDRAQGWSTMRANLNITHKYLSVVTDSSRGPRHGDRRAPEIGVQTEIITRAWTVMNRFLEFRKRGSVPLPESEFPILDS